MGDKKKMFDSWRGFAEDHLSDDWKSKLTEQARIARGNILKMTSLAQSGHPGGSMSSLEIYLAIYNFVRIDPKDPGRDDRDRVIVSHGHTSPGVYSALAAVGFFDIEPAIYGFRLAGSPFEGHVERSVPGVEWDTGNLGQGLSVGIGKALYSRLSDQDFHTYVLMGDGEQQKGQLSEARKTAVKLGLSNLTAVIDYNKLQISGKIDDVLPNDINADWKADGWTVLEIDAHDLDAVYDALRAATHHAPPTMILARSVMGKGVSFMENDHGYHGAALKMDKLPAAFEELGGIENDMDRLAEKRKQGPPPAYQMCLADYPEVKSGKPKTYEPDTKIDNRSAWGNALESIAEANLESGSLPMAVFDCDLAGSVKTAGFAKKYPNNFFQMGITEHNTAVVCGSLSAEKAVSIWADFGMFGIAEVYNQQRLNDINHANVKLFCTHSGVDVGEDGRTHQSIDYFGLLNSTFGWKLITPADPNQTDRIVRYVLTHPGNYAVIMGRSVIPVITDAKGRPYFGDKYQYRYGRMEQVRKGEDVALVAAGNMLAVALEAWNKLDGDSKRVSLISVSDWSDLHDDDLKMLAEYNHIVVLEDHNVKTGLGTAISSALFERGLQTGLTKMGVTEYASSGKPADLYRLMGIDANSVARKVSSVLNHVGSTA